MIHPPISPCPFTAPMAALDDVLTAHRGNVAAAHIRDWDQAYPSPSEERALATAEAVVGLRRVGLPVEATRNRGLVLVAERYIFAPSTGRWRVKGISRWYKSRGWQDFVTRFVMRKP